MPVVSAPEPKSPCPAPFDRAAIRPRILVLFLIPVLAGCAAAPAPVPEPPPAPVSGEWWPEGPPADPWAPVAALLLPTGELMIADTHQNRLFRMESPTAVPLRLPSPGVTPVEWTALAAAPGLSFFALDGPGQAVHQYDFHGNYVGLALDLEKLAAAERLGPIDPGGLAVDRSGYAVITDRLGDRLLAFGPGWSFVGTWGQSGAEPGSWRRPAAVAVGDRPPFLVADEGNRRLVLVSVLGDPIAERTVPEVPRGVAVLGPDRYAVSFEGGLWILDRGLVVRRTVEIPGGPGCSRRPYATPAVAGDTEDVWVGEGCSGLLLKIPLGGG